MNSAAFTSLYTPSDIASPTQLQLSFLCPAQRGFLLYGPTEVEMTLCLCVRFSLRPSRPGCRTGCTDGRTDAHAPHLSAAAVDQPPSVSVWEQPAVSSHGRTNRLSQIPAEAGADFGLILLLVRLWSPGALKIVHTGPYFCVCTLAKSNRQKTMQEVQEMC